MAIYSCNVKTVGKKTHAKGTAGAHIRYIARDGARADIGACHLPAEPKLAQDWMDKQEAEERANARMISKIMVALPIELSEEERYELVRDYVQVLTDDRIPWYFAIHQSGEDEHNPHAHIVLRDRDAHTGKRVLMLSDSARDRVKAGLPENGVEWIREQWELVCNLHLEQAGYEVRIDRRTLEEQGIDREPTIHLGAAGQRVEQPESKDRAEKTKLKRYRDSVPYPTIDQGRSRRERNTEIVEWNALRAAAIEHSNDNIRQGEMDMLSEEELREIAKKQAEQEIERLGEMDDIDKARKIEDDIEQRVKAFRESQAQEAEEARQKIKAEREAAREEDKSRNDLDIIKASSRYGQALGQEYDVRDPYSSLARAAMVEYGAFSKQQQALDIQISEAKDPEQRRVLELRKEIELCEYVAITDRRIARMDEVLAGRETSQVKEQRERADSLDERAQGLREEYRELRQQQRENTQERSPEEIEQERIKSMQQAWEQERERARNSHEHDIDRDL